MAPVPAISADGSVAAFEPGTVMVTLGEHGGTITLMKTADGGFTWNREAFDGGNVTGDNGNVYTHTLNNGVWTATNKPVEIEIQPEQRGKTLPTTKAEDGQCFDSLVAGRTLQADNEFAIRSPSLQAC